MNRSVRFLGHPVHQMLVVLPAGLLISAFLLDAAQLVRPSERLSLLSHWLLLGGLAGVALAAPFGFLDWRELPKGSRARRVGALHGLGNVIAAVLFGISWLMRTEGQPTPPAALALSLVAGGLLFITAWLGGELVSRLGVGVYSDAHVNATSSLTASEDTPSPTEPHTVDTPHPPPTVPPAVSPAAPAKSPVDLSVAGEEDPGAAIDTTDMAPQPRRNSSRRRR
jgi:uncharacterized membrane protein